jgi:putative salt-induced outer membrane protein
MKDKLMKKSLVLLQIPAVLFGAAFSHTAFAQATVKEDGQWRAAIGVGASSTSGNTKSTSINVLGDAVRATTIDKWGFYANSLYAKSAGEVTADQTRLGTRYDYNVTPQWFGFTGLDFERDKIAELDLRSAVSVGLGYHIIKNDSTLFDVFGGVGYTQDDYGVPRFVDGADRTDYSYTNLLIGEESTHKFSDTMSAKQKLVIYPNLANRGEYRAQFDSGLALAMSKTMNLTVGLSAKYNSDPGIGVKKTDTLFTTGISMKFE